MPSTDHHPSHHRLRALGRLIGQAALYSRPGMPTQQVPPLTAAAFRRYPPADPRR